ncbi:MAG: aconitate hydratase AcnA [Verrucomicrobia bacterium]|nr:aconitate hydratase AcnA [Verrucomicrobiota bacterium]MBV8484667.1 aconitate hydratase AcnA [Verrucomicrobiota bacterium]
MLSSQTVRSFRYHQGKTAKFYSLPALEEAGLAQISRLPVSIRIVLESVLRNCDGKKIAEKDVLNLARWNAKKPADEEIPFIVARIVLQDFTGVPLLVDLAAMRDAVAALGKDPQLIEPLVPVDLVVDHSVQVDFAGSVEALSLNLDYEFKRNRERYEFLKWGQQAFETFKVVPPGIGIVHQVNLEYLAKGVISAVSSGEEVCYPDTLVGTDSHTTMINGLGIVGWGVGGIEAEAGMLGQPVYFLTPEVVGVHLFGKLKEGVTATDLALRVTQMLRAAKVVGKFVEFYGEGAASLPLPDRATIANMAPEYGATMGFFPADQESINYFRQTGRSEEMVDRFEQYFRAQQLFGMPRKGQIDYSVDLELDLGSVQPSVAGPKRPQDRIDLDHLGSSFHELFSKPAKEGGYGKSADAFGEKVTVSVNGKQPAAAADKKGAVGHGSVLIAAITSCTNTSNPSVMLAAGLLAKKAVERGLKVNPTVKTSLAPGSRVVTDYLARTGLQPFLDRLGFNIVGYGCTTCIGNSGPLHPNIEQAITDKDLVAASVLSGNRNFEARVHQSIKANFLMSPPLVVAFALAGRVDIDLTHEPLGKDSGGKEVYLREIWPSLSEVRDAMASALSPEVFRQLYSDFAGQNPKWNEIPATAGVVYKWDEKSDYIHEPPYFSEFSLEVGDIADIAGARPLGIFGDSVTTDHISPAGAIKQTSPAGQYLIERGVKPVDFNSYGSRRGNDLVMTRGTFANVRIKNLMVPGVEGGVTIYYPDKEQLAIYDAAVRYRHDGVPLVVIAGHEYGTGSSRDWAAKGTLLLGVKAVIAQSFERIHRSNLVGMGVLPLQFADGTSAQSLSLDGSEVFHIKGLSNDIRPRQKLPLTIERPDGRSETIEVVLRIDTPVEVDYFRHGGILQYVLRGLSNAGEAR